ncbi:AbrB/MazE/SpoVT family DNA-binding domain-containing protein [Methanobrevibacter sp. TMH8]|nr:AbrB/MazE/SpoVT family DNA-binding domain-containing protein [Methanobrevibacter sp. TMH8]
MSTTKISKAFQTVVPSEFRKKYDIRPNDIIEWVDTKEGIKINIRKKITDEDIAGSLTGDFSYDSVKLKKMYNKGMDINKKNLKRKNNK